MCTSCLCVGDCLQIGPLYGENSRYLMLTKMGQILTKILMDTLRWGEFQTTISSTDVVGHHVAKEAKYSHNNCYQPSLQRLPSPHTIIVQAGSFTGKVITLCPSRHVKIPKKRFFRVPSVACSHPFSIGELTQLNKQDNTNFNLLGGHVVDVEFRDVDTTFISWMNYL